jgi:hypothetical protein
MLLVEVAEVGYMVKISKHALTPALSQRERE